MYYKLVIYSLNDNWYEKLIFRKVGILANFLIALVYTCICMTFREVLNIAEVSVRNAKKNTRIYLQCIVI